MLKERLLNNKFYLDHLSLFMKDSYGIIDRLNTYVAILNNVNDIADDIMSRFDIYNVMFEGDYFERNEIDKDGTDDRWLEIIGSIFNIERVMNVTYLDNDTQEYVTETLTLTNLELYLYIKVMISKINYQGTTEELIELYGNPFDEETYPDTSLKYLKIKYYWDTNSAVCNVYLPVGNNYSNNLIKLFLADKLIIESLGIQYNKQLVDGSVILGTFIAEDSDTEPYFYISGDPDRPDVYVFQ